MKQITVSDELYERLENLSQESSFHLINEYIDSITEKLDNDRHEQWSPKDQKFIRVKCGSKNCKETKERLSAGYRE